MVGQTTIGNQFENGDKEILFDKFGMAILTNGDSFKEIYSFAECEDLKENGYKFFISERIY